LHANSVLQTPPNYMRPHNLEANTISCDDPAKAGASSSAHVSFIYKGLGDPHSHTTPAEATLEGVARMQQARPALTYQAACSIEPAKAGDSLSASVSLLRNNTDHTRLTDLVQALPTRELQALCLSSGPVSFSDRALITLL
jgi:hypothetical protein